MLVILIGVEGLVIGEKDVANSGAILGGLMVSIEEVEVFENNA